MEPYIETNCTITHNGRDFSAGGAAITEQFIIAYPMEKGILGDWHGNPIGTYKILSTWKTPRSYVSHTMHSMECRVDGKRYVGRGAGVGMILRAKLSPRQ